MPPPSSSSSDSHACLLYEDGDERALATARYVREGLRRGERVFCALREGESSLVETALGRLGVDAAPFKTSGQLVMSPAREVYLAKGRFQAEAPIRWTREEVRRARREGYPGLRTTGVMDWWKEAGVEPDELLEYERQVHEGLSDLPWRGLCQYAADEVPASLLEELLSCHHELFGHVQSVETSNATESPVESATVKSVEKIADLESSRGEDTDLEAALESGESRERRMLEISPLMIGVHREGELLHGNEALADFLRAEGGEALVGRDVREFLAPKEHKRVRKMVEELSDGEVRRRVIREFELRDGRDVTLEVSSASILWEGATARIIFCFDRTGLDQTERALERARRRLQSAGDRFERIVRESPVAIAIARLADGRFLEVNPAYARMVGYERDELMGRRASGLALWRGERARDAFVSELQKQGEIKKREVAFQTKAGEVRYALASAVETHFKGEPCVLAFCTDITQRRRSERSLQLLQRLTDRVAAADDLDDALRAVLGAVGRNAGWRYGEAWLPAADRSELTRRSTWAADGADFMSFTEASSDVRFEVGEGLPGRVVERETPIWLSDVTTTDWYWRADEARSAGLRAAVGVPVMADEEVVGVLVFYDGGPTAEDREHVRTVSIAASHLGLALRRKRLQDHVRRREDQYSTMFNLSPLAITVSTLDEGVIVEASQGVERLLGYDPEELRGRSAEDIELWPHVSDRQSVVSRLRAGETVRSFETRLRTASGEFRDVELFAERIELDGREWMLAMSHDITRRKAAEEELRRSEEKFATVFRANPVAMVITSAEDGRIIDANEGFEEVFGYSPDEAIGATREELGLWVEERKAEKLRETLRSGGDVRGLEVMMRSRSGEELETLVYAEKLGFEGKDWVIAAALDVTEQNYLRRRLEEQALQDSLTRLPNRALFEDRLEHALERARRANGGVAVLFMDLDRFKVVNDSLGHTAGDELLTGVARRLEQCFRDEDTLARFGGDEFAAVLEDVGDGEAAVRAAERVIQAFDEDFWIGDMEVPASASIGIAVSSDELDDPGDLLRFSDVAMFRAKEERGTTYRVFDPARDSHDTTRLQLERDLRSAVERREFTLRYQPIVSIESGSLVGGEVLMRWDHPRRGLLSPGQFLGVAEETGIIVQIGEQILAQALETLRDWREQGLLDDDFTLSVNLSALEFQEAHIVERVERLLEQTGTDPARLQLEITETVAMQNPETLSELRALGVGIAVDDLGTGYASLEYLTHFDTDVLKIDKNFVEGMVEDPRDDAIVEAILVLADRLGMPVVAEGVETDRQLELLRENGCGFGQGYLFGRPGSADEFQSLLADRV